MPVPKRLGDCESSRHKGPITLVFAARDEKHNDALVLREVLLSGE